MILLMTSTIKPFEESSKDELTSVNVIDFFAFTVLIMVLIEVLESWIQVRSLDSNVKDAEESLCYLESFIDIKTTCNYSY